MAREFVHNEDQAFFLNGYQLSGILSLDANYSIPTEEKKEKRGVLNEEQLKNLKNGKS